MDNETREVFNKSTAQAKLDTSHEIEDLADEIAQMRLDRGVTLQDLLTTAGSRARMIEDLQQLAATRQIRELERIAPELMKQWDAELNATRELWPDVRATHDRLAILGKNLSDSEHEQQMRILHARAQIRDMAGLATDGFGTGRVTRAYGSLISDLYRLMEMLDAHIDAVDLLGVTPDEEEQDPYFNPYNPDGKTAPRHGKRLSDYYRDRQKHWRKWNERKYSAEEGRLLQETERLEIEQEQLDARHTQAGMRIAELMRGFVEGKATKL